MKTLKKSVAGLLTVIVLMAAGATGASSISTLDDERATQFARTLVCMKASWPPKPCRSA